MAATDRPLAALMQAALALPIAAIPAKVGAVEVGEVGITVLGYKERGLIQVIEPVVWGRARFMEVWEVQASAAADIVTGASPQLVTNESGRPVQTITGASVTDKRGLAEVKVTRRFDDFALAVSGAYSGEEDYRSAAFGVEARFDFNQRNTTLAVGYGHASDRIGSSDDKTLDEPRKTNEYLLGITQILSPTALVQSTFTAGRGRGWYNDPYKLTFTFFPGAFPILAPDRRPDHRNTLAWLTRYRAHFPAAKGTLQADYRFYRDDWGIRAHTLELGWQQSITERSSLRPALRYYTQQAADFYSPTVPLPQPAVQSSDQRLASFGGLSPSLRGIVKLDNGFTLEGTLGYVYNARNLRLGASGSAAFETLRAYYAILGISRAF